MDVGEHALGTFHGGLIGQGYMVRVESGCSGSSGEVKREEGWGWGGFLAHGVGIGVEAGVGVEHGGEGLVDAVDTNGEVAEGGEALGSAEEA